jgi:hypothetical protein
VEQLFLLHLFVVLLPGENAFDLIPFSIHPTFSDEFFQVIGFDPDRCVELDGCEFTLLHESVSSAAADIQNLRNFSAFE